MKLIIFTSFVLLSAAKQSCGKTKEASIPACVQARIEAIQLEPRWNPPATVTAYNYNGQKVFLFISNCCDQYNEVVDEKCNYVCAPSGGITGNGDRKCPDFLEKAQEVSIVWKDER